MLESALDELESAGVARQAVTVVPVPGAFELPLGAMALAKTRRFACIIALGCVIRGGKGAEAVRTALEMADLFTQLRATANA